MIMQPGLTKKKTRSPREDKKGWTLLKPASQPLRICVSRPRKKKRLWNDVADAQGQRGGKKKQTTERRRRWPVHLGDADVKEVSQNKKGRECKKLGDERKNP